MQKVGLWEVDDGKLKRIPEKSIDLEKQLEAWIEEDPTLLQSGLVIVGRQLSLEGGRLDLLALDPQGRWVVIEIKKGAVRRETIAQVIDYAACINELSRDEFRNILSEYLTKHHKNIDELLEERDATDALEPGQRRIILTVVGTGRSSGLDRMGNYLASKCSVPISIVSFDVFSAEGEKQILAREISEPEATGPNQIYRPDGTVEQVIGLAEREGTAKSIRTCIDKAKELGLYPHPWKASIMFAPAANKTRALFTIWAVPQKGKIRMWVGDEVFSEFYDVQSSTIRANLGSEGWRSVTEHEIEIFLNGLDRLFRPLLGEGAESS